MSTSLRRSARIRKAAHTISYTEIDTDHDIDTSPSHSPQPNCICDEDQNGRMMICCDKCDVWYHADCMNLKESTVKSLSASKESWFCLNCQRKSNPRSTKRKRSEIASELSPKRSHKRRKTLSTNADNDTHTTFNPTQTTLHTHEQSPTNAHNELMSISSPQTEITSLTPGPHSANVSSLASTDDSSHSPPTTTTSIPHTNDETSNTCDTQQAIANIFSECLDILRSNPKDPSFSLPVCNETNECKQSQDTVSTVPNEACAEPMDGNADAEGDSDTDLEILSNTDDSETMNNLTKLKFIRSIFSGLESDNDCAQKTHTNTERKNGANAADDEDSEIEIKAGDEWIESDTFFKNQEMIEANVKNQRKAKRNRLINEREDESEFVVLNENKKSKSNVCPLSLKQIRFPIKNMLCSHMYEREAIRNYRDYMIKNEKKNIVCPMPGCSKMLWIPTFGTQT